MIQWINSPANKYSVQASAVGRPVEVRACADRIELRQDGRVVGEHARAFGRGETVYNPWRYVPVLARNPARFGTARPSSIGCCRPLSSEFAASFVARRTAIDRWWRSSAPC